MQDFLIVSYYTFDTPYQQVCHDYLMPSVLKLGLECDIRAVQNLGSWQFNTSYKAEFVGQMLEHHKRNLVFLDSDATIMSNPNLFNEIPKEYDIACHLLDKNAWYGDTYDPQFELLSGTVFFRYSSNTLKLIEKWKELCNQYFRTWEQQLLQTAITSCGTKVFNLPLEYCYIKSLPDGREPLVKVENPVIIHHQVSRSLRNKINDHGI